MDKLLFRGKYVSLYFSTLTIGVGCTVVPQNKSFHLLLGVFELEICLVKE